MLLVNDNTPRGHWKLGLAIERKPDQDDLVRTAKDKNKDSVYVRSIQKLCLLETDLSPREKPQNWDVLGDRPKAGWMFRQTSGRINELQTDID